MKTKLSLFMVLLLSIIYCCISAVAEDMIELSVPENMPDSYIGYYWIDGDKTNGVTFVVCDIRRDSQLIEINVMQLPNDDYTSLVDNQVEYPSTATHFVREIESAKQHGNTILGTLCDIYAITDENGNDLLDEYSVSAKREGASLVNKFSIHLPTENLLEIHVELEFGVNEDLSCRFDRSDTYSLTIPMDDSLGMSL